MWATGQIVAPGSSATHLPGLAGPAIAAVLVTAVERGRSGLHDIAARCVMWPRMRPGVFAMALSPFVALAGVALTTDDPAAMLRYPGLSQGIEPIAGIALVMLLNGIGEELGWRGFAFDRLAPRGRLRAALIVAALWAVWHAPLFAVHQGFAGMVGPLLLGWLAGLIAGSIVLGWLYLGTRRSVGFVAAWHVAYNYASATPRMAGVGAALVSTVVTLAGLAIAWRWWRTDR